jgi:hypothetical protein
MKKKYKVPTGSIRISFRLLDLRLSFVSDFDIRISDFFSLARSIKQLRDLRALRG